MPSCGLSPLGLPPPGHCPLAEGQSLDLIFCPKFLRDLELLLAVKVSCHTAEDKTALNQYPSGSRGEKG